MRCEIARQEHPQAIIISYLSPPPLPLLPLPPSPSGGTSSTSDGALRVPAGAPGAAPTRRREVSTYRGAECRRAPLGAAYLSARRPFAPAPVGAPFRSPLLPLSAAQLASGFLKDRAAAVKNGANMDSLLPASYALPRSAAVV